MIEMIAVMLVITVTVGPIIGAFMWFYIRFIERDPLPDNGFILCILVYTALVGIAAAAASILGPLGVLD